MVPLLIALRRSVPELRAGRLDEVITRCDEEAGWLVVERGRVVIAANLGTESLRLDLGPESHTMLLASARDISLEDDQVALLPDRVAVLRISAS